MELRGQAGDGGRLHKGLGHSEYNDNRNKRPAYAASGWVEYGVTEAGDEKTNGNNKCEKAKHGQ